MQGDSLTAGANRTRHAASRAPGACARRFAAQCRV